MYYHFQMMHQIIIELKILVLKDDQCSYTWLKYTDDTCVVLQCIANKEIITFRV